MSGVAIVCVCGSVSGGGWVTGSVGDERSFGHAATAGGACCAAAAKALHEGWARSAGVSGGLSVVAEHVDGLCLY